MRRALIGIVAIVAPLVAGCGFAPLYGDHARVMEADLATVKILPIPEHIGQLLQWQLEKEFNPDGVEVPPRYALHVGLAIQPIFSPSSPTTWHRAVRSRRPPTWR